MTLVVEFMECDSCLLYLLDNHELVLRAGNRPSAVGNVAGDERGLDGLGGSREALARHLKGSF